MTDITEVPADPAPDVPPKPDAILNADLRLTAYLKARGDDFAKLGWKDGGSIEIRGGHTLCTPDIDITLRRARAAEKARDQALAENEALRRALVDAHRHNGPELLDPGPIADAMAAAQAAPAHASRITDGIVSAEVARAELGAPGPVIVSEYEFHERRALQIEPATSQPTPWVDPNGATP